jgi:hypothetical protein
VWTSLTVAALALMPAQPTGGLTLSNVRLTYGELGGTRPETKLLPGDLLFVAFDIDGLTINPEGTATYSMALEVTDTAGKTIFKQEPADKTDFVPLGGTRVPGRAYILAGYDQPAGVYTLTVTVADTLAKGGVPKTLAKKFEVAEKGFGIVSAYTSADPEGRIPAPTTGILGESVFVQFVVIGFQRDPKTKNQPNVQVEMQPLDDAGRPTMTKPGALTVDAGVDEKDPGFTLRFPLPLTRLGKYTVRLKATDNVAKKTATFDLPVAVVPSAN